MTGPEAIILIIVGAWLTIAAIVIAYPLFTGRIRVGLDPVSRENDPQAFWNAYIFSTILFVAASIVVGFFMRAMLHWKP